MASIKTCLSINIRSSIRHTNSTVMALKSNIFPKLSHYLSNGLDCDKNVKSRARGNSPWAPPSSNGNSPKMSPLYKVKQSIIYLRLYGKQKNESKSPCKRKLGHNFPYENVKPNFEPVKELPSGVFRNTTEEVLGPGAGKSSDYKNPEYYSYHHMTYYDVHVHLRKNRLYRPNLERKPP